MKRVEESMEYLKEGADKSKMLNPKMNHKNTAKLVSLEEQTVESGKTKQMHMVTDVLLSAQNYSVDNPHQFVTALN